MLTLTSAHYRIACLQKSATETRVASAVQFTAAGNEFLACIGHSNAIGVNLGHNLY